MGGYFYAGAVTKGFGFYSSRKEHSQGSIGIPFRGYVFVTGGLVGLGVEGRMING